MAIAGNITLVTVTGEYVDYRGNAIAGQVIFTLPKTLRNELADQIMVPSSFAATLNAFGQFSIVLPASDDPQFNESFIYTITEAFAGGRTWQATLPEAQTNVKMADLVPAYTGGAFSELASYQAYVYEEQAVTTQEGFISYSPAGVVLSSSYGNVAFVFPTYASVLADRASYATLVSLPVVAETSDILPLDDIRVNLVPNPSLEVGTTGWTTIGSGTTIARIATDSLVGVACLEVTKGATGNRGAWIDVSVTTGLSYTFSFYVKVASGQESTPIQAWIDWRNAGYLSTTASSPVTVTSASGWTRVSITGTAPATATIARCYALTGSGTAGQRFRLDGVLVEQASTLGAYFDGSFGGFWTGTAHASTSRNATVPSYALVAEGWADLAIEQAEELFPHPFTFTGSLGVQR